ncbi:MAG: hypothetical protein COB46_08080 [Rhodospirillaceae bacterium]|nr:MAG: hypothetical protein COB46_08080 [Rhodospirillaceae bacterium]
MLGLRLLVFVIVAPTLAGVFMLVALIVPMGMDQVTAIVSAVGIGTLVAVPASVVLEKMIRHVM